MALHRLTTLTLGVPDPETAGAFYAAFGLEPRGRGRFATRDGGEQLRLVTAPRRGAHHLGIGADDPDDLDRIHHELGRRQVPADRDAAGLHLREPVTGLPMTVEVAPRLATGDPADPPTNGPSGVGRWDRPAAAVLREAPVRPSNLTHLVLTSPDQAATVAFLVEALGFEVSDEVPGIIAFTRCGEVHHNLAVQAAPGSFVHHVAFEVDDVDDVLRGASALVEADAGRHVWGLGRHAIGSNWFWYLRDPAGNFVEYAADVDRITAQDRYAPGAWSGHQFLYAYGPPPPAEFFEPEDAAELLDA